MYIHNQTHSSWYTIQLPPSVVGDNNSIHSMVHCQQSIFRWQDAFKNDWQGRNTLYPINVLPSYSWIKQITSKTVLGWVRTFVHCSWTCQHTFVRVVNLNEMGRKKELVADISISFAYYRCVYGNNKCFVTGRFSPFYELKSQVSVL